MRAFLAVLAAGRHLFQGVPGPSPAVVPSASYAPSMPSLPYAGEQIYVVPYAARADASPASGTAAGALLLGAAVGFAGVMTARPVAALFGSGKKAAPKGAAAKKAPAKKAPAKAPVRKAAPTPAARARTAPVKAGRRLKSGPIPGKSPKGKGGIFPWITNKPGTYAEPLRLSAIDFLSDDGDKWIGWGAMPSSVKKLYNRNGKKGLLDKPSGTVIGPTPAFPKRTW